MSVLVYALSRRLEKRKLTLLICAELFCCVGDTCLLSSDLPLFAGGIGAFLIGLITIWAPRPIVIVTSAFSGGVGASGILFHQVLSKYFWAQMGYVQNFVVFIVGIILAIFGMIIQFQRK